MEFTGNVVGYATSVVSPPTPALCRPQQIVQWTDYVCSFIESDYSWRIPLLIQCVIGAVLAAGSFVMPESPR
jgi:hypothetical protein